MKNKLTLEVTMGPDYKMSLHARDMNELVEKIKTWQDWDDCEKALKAFKKSKAFISKEKKSGWYYFKDKK